MIDESLGGAVQYRIRYGKKLRRVFWEHGKEKTTVVGIFFHRKDYNEDGSVTETHGIELSRADFLELGGQELEEDNGKR